MSNPVRLDSQIILVLALRRRFDFVRPHAYLYFLFAEYLHYDGARRISELM